MSITFTWTARLEYFDRISKVWRKPVFLTITAERMETASRKAVAKYRLEYLSYGDRKRASRIKLDLERMYELTLRQLGIRD